MRPLSPAHRDLFALAREAMPDAVVSHDSAAYVHGLINEEPTLLHVAVPHGSARHRTQGVVLHQSLVPESVVVDKIPLLTLARTAVVYAAGVHSPLDAAGVLYRAAHELKVDPQDLLRHAAMSPRGGRGAVSRAARELAAGARSVPEGVIWTACWEIGLPVPELNPPIRVAGKTLYPDCLFREHMTIVEIDGREHHSTPRQIAADARRQELLENLGFAVLRFPASHVLYRADHVMATLMAALGEERPIHAWARRYLMSVARTGAVVVPDKRRNHRRAVA